MKLFFRFSMTILVTVLATGCTSPSSTVSPNGSSIVTAPAPSPSTASPREPASDVQIGSTACTYKKNNKNFKGRCPVVSCLMSDRKPSTKIIYPDKETLCGSLTEFTDKRSCKFEDFYVPYGHAIRVYEKMVVAAGEYCRHEDRVCGENGAMTEGWDYLTCRVAEDPTNSSTVE